MDTTSATIASLVEFHTPEQIRVFWSEAAQALMSRSTALIHITTTAFEGQSSSGIVLSTPDEIAAFIGACKAAIAQLAGSKAVDASTLGTCIDFSRRTLQV